jgi:hypothetical protein
MLFNIQSSALTATLLLSLLQTVTGEPIILDSDPVPTDTPAVSDPAGDFNIQSGCVQGDCPDYGMGLDFFRYALHVGDGRINVKRYIRVNYYGKCHRIQLFGKTDCANFTKWGKDFEICIDRNRSRAHRKINGKKDCFDLAITSPCGLFKIWRITKKHDRCPW